MCDSGENKNTEEKNRNDKENCLKPRRFPRTKKEQFDLISNFYENNNESLMDSEIFHGNWCSLVDSLNAIGPPIHASGEWRRIWSEHKYNKKRKRASASDLNLPSKLPKMGVTPDNVLTVLDVESNGTENNPTSANIQHQSNTAHTERVDPHQCDEYVSDMWESLSPFDEIREFFVLSNTDTSFTNTTTMYDGSTNELDSVTNSCINPTSSQSIYTTTLYDESIIPTSSSGQSVNVSDVDAVKSPVNRDFNSSISLSDVTNKLDTIIDHQVEIIDLLKELVKKK